MNTENLPPIKQGLFRRIFALYGMLLVLSIIGTELYVAGTVRESRTRDLRKSLSVQADLIGQNVPFRDPAVLDELCRRLKDATGSRVTIITLAGKVQGDSDHASASMDNHLTRVEVQQAILSGTGSVVRHSDTLDSNMIYLARKITQKGRAAGIVRLSMPLGDVDASVRTLRIRMLLAVVAILLMTGLFSLWQIERVRRLTVQIRDFARALAKGDLGQRLFLGRAGEFDEIADSLNSMSLDLKHSIAATEEERNRLSVILSSIPDALLISDAQGIIRLTSAASRTFFGDLPLTGRQFIEVVRDRHFLAALDIVRREHRSETAEVTLDRPSEQHCIVRISPLFYRAGELSGMVAVFHDVTQLKKLEQVRKDFVANISHEIRTPITAIQGFAETLLDGAIDDRENSRKFVETIRENSKRINSLVEDLMTISKIELGVISVERSVVAFQDAADAVFAVLRDKAVDKGLELRRDIPPGIGVIQADRDRLIQVLTNLVENAIKFTDRGSVTLGITENNDRTSIYVSDTGIGIQEKHLPRLGERFYRVDAARSRTMGGTGLGLAIVKHLVKAHGWEMRIKSTLGKGTTVTILLEPDQGDAAQMD
ncbi:MAG: ATP-binding protein [Nitrospirota bacterium]|nr:ATP-binding protein [Nitrospirota bacterium]